MTETADKDAATEEIAAGEESAPPAADETPAPEADETPAPEADEPALSAQLESPLATGQWGSCDWQISSQGVLTVQPGEGATQPERMPDPFEVVPSLWNTYRNNITKVVFNNSDSARVKLPENCQRLFDDFTKATSFELGAPTPPM